MIPFDCFYGSGHVRPSTLKQLSRKEMMNNMRLGMWLVVLSGIVGCGGTSAKPLPKTAPVSGKVTLDGQPLKGATVTFSPTGTTKGIECTGITDDAGAYKLKQIRGEDGAPPGEYTVVISRFLKKDGS